MSRMKSSKRLSSLAKSVEIQSSDAAGAPDAQFRAEWESLRRYCLAPVTSTIADRVPFPESRDLPAVDRPVRVPADFRFGRTVGTGSFGRVFFARDSGLGCVAVKRMKKYELIRRRQVDHIMDEVAILWDCCHPFVVKLHVGAAPWSHRHSAYVYICMEFVKGGEFYSIVRRYAPLPDMVAKFYAAQVVSILSYLHAKCIVYRDLKPENLLMAPSGYLKLADFGFAKFIQPGHTTRTLCGTPEYLAPEMLISAGHDKAVDWWTLGIFLFEMLVGDPPFSGGDPAQMYREILSTKLRFPSFVDSGARSLIKRLLVPDPRRRLGTDILGSEQVMQHRCFDVVDWVALEAQTLPPPYVPPIDARNDTACFERFSEESEQPPRDIEAEDPFWAW
ncbi:MAG: hypothetical protein KVP17_004036 [Porospora cf. gigantea B]|uniref:uncharacterized protein n=1 Tax=Porospora cf. gigantea B TaxID=2853592 RepID=UPI003571E59A|nr:MAG: hypothetical protein KVP17_004036 [Porospora cf. gigantea B]